MDDLNPLNDDELTYLAFNVSFGRPINTVLNEIKRKRAEIKWVDDLRSQQKRPRQDLYPDSSPEPEDTDYTYKVKIYKLYVDPNLSIKSLSFVDYKTDPTEVQSITREFKSYRSFQLTSSKPFKYGLLSDLKDHVTNYTKGFDSCAGECIHFAVAVQLWHRLSREIDLMSPFDGVPENTIVECYDQAMRFLKFYSWLGPNAHDIICATANYIIDFKANITSFVIENHIDKDDTSPDYIITYDDRTKWYGDLKSFHHREEGDAISYMNGLTEYDVVFFLSLSFIDNEPTFTLGNYANKEPSDKEEIEYNISPDWAHLDQKEPFFKIQSFVRHGEFYTFAGRIFHFVMPYIIMSCYELKESDFQCTPSKKRKGILKTFVPRDRKNPNFVSERNKVMIPLLKCTISRDADETALGRFGDRILDDLKVLMKKYRTNIEIEWKTRWVGDRPMTGKMPQTVADMIISPMKSDKPPRGTSIGAVAQFTFIMKDFSLRKGAPVPKYGIRVAIADGIDKKGRKIQKIWAEQDLGDPEIDGRNTFKEKKGSIIKKGLY